MQAEILLKANKWRIQGSKSASKTPFFQLRRPSLRALNCSTGNGKPAPNYPSPAEVARTVVDISNEGTLSTISVDGIPLGTSVSYSVNKQNQLFVSLSPNGLELESLRANSKCSLLVQPISFPARAIGAVSLIGQVGLNTSQNDQYPLTIDKCLYFGGFDQVTKEISADEFLSAEPDVLRRAAAELISCWNSERAEDIYRIVSHFLHVPLTEMVYAELIWIDRLGLYIRTETSSQSSPRIVRVPFYRPVLDERDARSVITMAAQMAWEADRRYVPQLPSIFLSSATPAGTAADN